MAGELIKNGIFAAMECARIRERFSEYMDGCLQDQDRADVEKHLSTCEDCRNELAYVKTLVRELGSLYSVKAPSDFLENVHKRREPAEEPTASSRLERILQKLFIPLRVKIPLELAAAAAAVILVLGVYHIDLPQKSDETLQKAASQAGRQQPPSAPVLEQESDKSESFFDELDTGPTTGTGAPVELVLLVRHNFSQEAGLSAGNATEPISPAGEKALATVASMMENAQETQTQRGDISDPSAPEDVLSINTPPVDESASLEFTEDEEIRSRILDIITTAGGSFLPPQQQALDTHLSIYAEIPSEQYNLFCRKMKKLGAFQSPPPQPDTNQPTVSLLIRLIAPE